MRDQSTVLSIPSLIHDFYGIGDVCLSLPTIVDRGGVEKVLHLELNPKELEGLRNSAAVLKQNIQVLGL